MTKKRHATVALATALVTLALAGVSGTAAATEAPAAQDTVAFCTPAWGSFVPPFCV
jgi:ABC-type proline/glycine betaine transport system substrate-binding protein